MAHSGAKHTAQWGKDTAAERYSVGKGDSMEVASENLCKPQDPEDKQAAGYENDASGWVRGEGGGEAKPGFDHSRKGK